jgi:hypothetical protein
MVNERFVTRPAELEDHWKVDCAASRQQALALSSAGVGTTGNSAQAGPGDLQHLHDALNKCAMIYNAPGSAGVGSCPDYMTATLILRVLSSPDRAGTDWAARLRSALECPPQN